MRVATAWVVRVGFGPPNPFARAELSATNSRFTQRASAEESTTEVAADWPIRIDDCTCRISGAQSIR